MTWRLLVFESFRANQFAVRILSTAQRSECWCQKMKLPENSIPSQNLNERSVVAVYGVGTTS